MTDRLSPVHRTAVVVTVFAFLLGSVAGTAAHHKPGHDKGPTQAPQQDEAAPDSGQATGGQGNGNGNPGAANGGQGQGNQGTDPAPVPAASGDGAGDAPAAKAPATAKPKKGKTGAATGDAGKPAAKAARLGKGPAAKVRICHATGSETMPYIFLIVGAGATKGHAKHHEGADLIGVEASADCPTAAPAGVGAGDEGADEADNAGIEDEDAPEDETAENEDEDSSENLDNEDDSTVDEIDESA